MRLDFGKKSDANRLIQENVLREVQQTGSASVCFFIYLKKLSAITSKTVA
jgi:hypothetical protein